jgi:hypothetical protein
MADIDASEPALWNEIKELEQREANAMLRADVSELDLLWADDLLVNSTANLIADKKILLAMIREGRLRLRSYSRLTLKAAINGDILVTTGNEHSQMEGPAVGLVLHCSYMNSWIRRGSAWRLLGRHVGLIERSSADTKPRR